MKKALVIVTLSMLLSACAGWHGGTAHPTVAANAIPGTAPTADQAQNADQALQSPPTAAFPNAPTSGSDEYAAQVGPDGLPALNLSGDIMFHYLAAEIAFQRGDWVSAYETMRALTLQTHDPRVAQRAFEMAWLARQPEEALAASKLWCEYAPHSEDARQNYFNAIVMVDSLDEAQTVFERTLSDSPAAARGAVIFQIQRLLSRAKDKDAAYAVLESLLAPYPDLLESHLALAYGAYAKGDNTKAQAEAEISLKAKPDSETAALILAQVNPDRDAALKFLARFVSAHPASKDLRLAYAKTLVEQKRYKEAVHELGALLKSDPQDLSVLYMLGILEAQTNDTKAAERHLSNFIEVLSDHPGEDHDPTSALQLLSQLAEERKDYDAALRWLDLIDAPEAHVGTEIRRAALFAKKGNIEGARKLLNELAPQDQQEQIQVIAAEAQILRDANQAKAAMSVLEDGIKRFPENTDLLYDYAMDAEKNNQLDVCEKALRKIIGLAPQNQQAYNALGYTFAERNIRLDEAYTLVETALKLAPDDPFIIDSMGWVQYRLGRLKESEELLRHAYSLRPDPEIAVHLGEVLWVKGQKADAHKLWREAGIKDPENDALKNTLARLHVSL